MKIDEGKTADDKVYQMDQDDSTGEMVLLIDGEEKARCGSDRISMQTTMTPAFAKHVYNPKAVAAPEETPKPKRKRRKS